MVLHISQKYLEELCGHSQIPLIQCYSNAIKEDATYSLILNCMAGIYLSLSSNNRYSDIFAKSQAELLFSILLEYYSHGEPTPWEQKLNQEQKKNIQSLIKYINRHFREKITLNNLAEVAQMNSFYVST